MNANNVLLAFISSKRKVMQSITDTCFSGGCEGADLAFGDAAKRVGHKVMHFSFQSHTAQTHPDAVVLNLQALLVSDPFLRDANKHLKRKYPTISMYVNNLLRRNYYQIKDTDRVYAVSHIDEKDNLVSGGTGWAVMMAMLRDNRPPIYVFDEKKLRWFSLRSFDKRDTTSADWGALEFSQVPRPSGKYTGIGSHDLTSAGSEEIRKLFSL